ncbi:MAG: Fic family protein [Candidatus Levybacteria bacterium]|nr:Fic family protein [Candidatus Levybacteria bacterium]
MNNIHPHQLKKLPPREIDYISLVQILGEARAVLGELKGQLSHVSPELINLLVAPLLTKEAILSSKIEGTQATMEAVLKYEAQENKPQNNTEEVGYKEIINYRKAVQMVVQETTPIGENLIKDAHRVLMDSVRGAKKNPGSFRRIEVAIGRLGQSPEKATYFPPLNTEVTSLMNDWEKYMHNVPEKDDLVKIGIGHYQFEAIHPFMDGNGRIGRLLIPLFLYQKGILPYPVIYISEFFEEHRQDYYDLLNNVTQKGEWEPWLIFFLTGIIETSKKTINTINKMDKLYYELKESITSVNSIYAINLLDIIFETPVVTYVSLKSRLNTKSPQTIYNLLQKFIEKGILSESEDKQRGREFKFDRLVNLLD